MKKCIYSVVILLGASSFVSQAQAAEYQCTISSTHAEGCETYFTREEVCLFPAELNIQRTQEAETSSFTYPEFCSVTCAEKSDIPARCRKGSITEIALTEREKESVSDMDDEARGGYIPRDVYKKSDSFFGRILNWIHTFWRGDNYEIQPMSTPVAGVRG